MNSGNWLGRRVLVTGHTGFKGAWLCLLLEKLGAAVAGFSLPPATHPDLFSLARLDGFVDSTLADIRDASVVDHAVRNFTPEVVFHLAAQAIVRDSYYDPVGTYATNVMGLVHLLEAVRRQPSVKAVVIVTSDKCYENREWVWTYRESDHMGGLDPYSSSKGCAELVVAAYRRSFFGTGTGKHPALIATARSGNVVGGGDWAAHRLVPDLFRAWGAGKPVAIRNPESVRPWQHVLEPLGAYLLLADRLVQGDTRAADAFNFGPRPGDARSVRGVVEAMAYLWGEGARWESDGNGDHPHEAGQLRLDSSKAEAFLGWVPRLQLDRALPRVVDWQRAFLRGDDMREVTRSQIEEFLRLPAL